jgi:hypothetical protein
LQKVSGIVQCTGMGFRFLKSLVLMCCGLIIPAHGLQVRSYLASRNDRFTGFPAAPAANASFLYSSYDLTGVGWLAGDTNTYRQITLISRKHFVCATHYSQYDLVPGATVQFLDSTGTLISRTVSSLYRVPDSSSSSGITDVTIGTLDSPVPLTVSTLPYLNKGASNSESSYKNLSLMVFGKIARAGSGTLGNGVFLTAAINSNDTRLYYYTYSTSGTGQDDAYLEIGDSGAPNFVATSGKAALIGINTAVDTTGNPYINYSAFIPHYITAINSYLSTYGYRISPVTLTGTTLAMSSTAPSGQRQMAAGTISVTVSNAATATAGSVELRLDFGSYPADSITVPSGWVSENIGSGVWSVRTATLAASGSATFTANWSALPPVATFTPTLKLVSDASTTVTATPSFTFKPSFAAWASNAGISSATQTGDNDGDGINNLLEYALGGDPLNGTPTFSSTHPLLPSASVSSGALVVSYPERTDASDRGLTYTPEWSADLSTWSSTLPSGSTSTTAAWSPAVTGFVQRQISIPVSGTKRFVRVKVLLSE